MFQGNIALTKHDWKVVLSGCVYNTALAYPGPSATEPVTATSTGVAVVRANTDGMVAVMFAGTTTAAHTGAYQAFGMHRVKDAGNDCWMPEKLAEGTFALGTQTVGAAGAFIEASTSLIAGTITETTSNPSSRVYSPAANENAVLYLDASRFDAIYVQVTRNGNTAITIDVLMQVYTGGGFASLDMGDAADVATASLQGAANTLLGTIDTDIGTIDADTGSIKTNTDTFVAGGGGGYVRQDSTGTIAKETGGNLAALVDFQDGTIASRTNSTKAVTQSAAGYFLVGGDGSKTVRVRSGVITGEGSSGSILFKYSDDNAGVTNAVSLSGEIAVGVNGGFILEKDEGLGHFIIPAAKYLGFTSTTVKAEGWLNISLE